MRLGEAIFPQGPRDGLHFAACVVRQRRETEETIPVLREPAGPMHMSHLHRFVPLWPISHSQPLQSALSFWTRQMPLSLALVTISWMVGSLALGKSMENEEKVSEMITNELAHNLNSHGHRPTQPNSREQLFTGVFHCRGPSHGDGFSREQ